jgi:hypothetical protein
MSGFSQRFRLGAVSASLAAVLLLPTPTVAAAPGSGASSAVIDPQRYLIGGCAVAFSEYGTPRLLAGKSRPCIGAESVRIDPSGDLVIALTQTSRRPVLRLLVSVDTAMTRRGITAGVSGGKDTLTVRLYDDLLEGRLDLRRADHRRRLGKVAGQVSVGWTKAADVGPDGEVVIDPGIDALGAYRDLATSDADTVQGGCVVRFEDGRPRIHANPSHRCVGVKSVGVTSTGRLRVELSDEQRGSVVNAQADPDETLTSRGIILGTSGGVSYFEHQFYDSRLNRPLNLNWTTDRGRVAGANSNVWLTWTKTAKRPGAINASAEPAPNEYGPYMDGSAEPGTIIQTGCTIGFSQVQGRPFLNGNSAALCSGVASVSVNSIGAVVVVSTDEATAPVVSTTTISSRALTDYGVRAGLSGGTRTSAYRIYSLRLGRVLDLTKSADRVLLQRSGSSLSVGWSRVRS